MPNGQSDDAPTPAALLQIGSIPLVMVGVLILVAMSTKGVDIATGVMGGASHRAVVIYGFATVATFLSLWLVMGAMFAYLNVGQKIKVQVIQGFYTADTIAAYFEQFWAGRDDFRILVNRFRAACANMKDADPAIRFQAAADAEAFTTELEQTFAEMFVTDYGPRMFMTPIMTFLAAGSIVLFLGYSGGLGYALSLTANNNFAVTPFGIKFDLVTIAAIFGAYTWVASDAIVRAHQWTLHPSDLAWYTLRLIIAVPLGQALAIAVSAPATAGTATTAATSSAGAFAAFVGSMFSLDAITKALGTAATRFGLQMQSSTAERDDLIVNLAGVDDSKANALSVEGISTIGQLVTIDPVRVSIRTGLSFEYVLNLVNAALLWVFVGNVLKQLAPLGIRGASDVLALGEDWDSVDAAARARTAMSAADQTLTHARQAADDARAAFAAAQTQDEAVLGPLRTAAQQMHDAWLEAFHARDAAVTDYVAAVTTPAVPPDRTTMLAALQAPVAVTPLTNPGATSGPGLTKVGFETILARLRQSHYALFVRTLLDDRRHRN